MTSKKKEEWKDIKSTNGEYSVSNFGRVRSNERTIMRSNGRKYKVTETILKDIVDSEGYHRVNLGRFYMAKIHREVAKAFIENPLNLKEVNHKNGDKSDNSVENLEWITHGDNIRHAFENAFVIRKRKLSDEQIHEIRRRYKPRCRKNGARAMAREFGLKRVYMWEVASGKVKTRKELGQFDKIKKYEAARKAAEKIKI